MNAEDLIESLLKYPDVPVVIRGRREVRMVVKAEPVLEGGRVIAVELVWESKSEN